MLTLHAVATVVATMTEEFHESSTESLIKALRILARDIQSEDGVANAVIAEAAQRIQELSEIQQFQDWKIAALTDGIDAAQVSLDEWRDARRN